MAYLQELLYCVRPDAAELTPLWCITRGRLYYIIHCGLNVGVRFPSKANERAVRRLELIYTVVSVRVLI